MFYDYSPLSSLSYLFPMPLEMNPTATRLFVWFCDPLSLTRAICVTLGLKLCEIDAGVGGHQ